MMAEKREPLLPLTRNLYLGIGADAVAAAVQAGHRTVIFDVLRAGATLCQLLACPIRKPIWVAREVAECRRLKTSLGTSTVLVGERNAQPLPGFDYGNSPTAIARAVERLRGRTVIFTSTAGGRALSCGIPGGTYLGSLTNATAVRDLCLRLHRQGERIALIAACGDFEGDPLIHEDWLVILYVLAWFSLSDLKWPWPDFQGRAAEVLESLRTTWDWQRHLARTTHGRNLYTLGYGEDVAWIANHFGEHRWVPRLIEHPDNRPGSRMALWRDEE